MGNEIVKKYDKHKDIRCSVRGCKEPSRYWLPTDKLSGDFDLKTHTFFLCSEHCEKLSYLGEFEFYSYLNPETGRIREIEIGVYACSENCRECN